MSQRLLVAAALAAALAAPAGCMNASFTTRAPAAAAHYQQHSFFLWGLVGDAVVDAGALCPRGIASVRKLATGIDVALSVITVGIYSPRTTEIVCSPGPEAAR